MKLKTRIRYFNFLLIFIFIGPVIDVTGQNVTPSLEGKSFKEIKATAKSALRLGDIYTALFYYEEWVKRKPENHSISYQLAELYRSSRNYTQAETAYLKIVKNHVGKYKMSTFYLAHMQMSLEKYDEAKSNFTKFKKVSKEFKDTKYRKLAKSGIESCDFVMQNRDSTNSTTVQHLGNSVNNAHIEFSPIVIDDDKIIYGSLKDDAVNYYNVALHDSMKIPLRKFYYAEKENGAWVDKGEVEGPFNSDDMHIGNGVMSEDGSRMYFTKCAKNWKGKVICQLYYTNFENGEWQSAIKMNDLINMADYTTTQPAIGRESKRNREIVYFVSDRPGGKGGLDIWYTEYRKKKGFFKAPKNAGSKVNSVATDCTPYYDLSTRTLYFSSDGRETFGGLDVLKTVGEKSKFEEAVNIGQKVNSSADDIDFTLSKNRQGGFIVSNRKGGQALLNETCCDDIYEFTFSEYVIITLDAWVKSDVTDLVDYSIKVYMKNVGQEGEGTEVEEGRFLTHNTSSGLSNFKIHLEQGREYTIEVIKEGYFNGVVKIDTDQYNETKTIQRIINLSKISKDPVVLEGILYEYDSANLTEQAMMTIDTTLYEILVDNPNIIVEIASHTDNKGTNIYNQDLSKKRAEGVVNYLVEKGIDWNRMQYKGFGESKPIADNEHADGSDNPEGRQLNRRTDFSIVGNIDLDEFYDDDDEKRKVNIKKRSKAKSGKVDGF